MNAENVLLLESVDNSDNGALKILLQICISLKKYSFHKGIYYGNCCEVHFGAFGLKLSV